MLIGFTGTRKGLSGPQRATLKGILNKLRRSRHAPIQLRNGCAIGADAECAELLESTELIGYPASGPDGTLHDDCDGATLIHCGPVMSAKPPLTRNGDIVRGSKLLIACPAEECEQPRGGTWSTIRLARKLAKPAIIVVPDGEAILDVPGSPDPFTFGELEALVAEAATLLTSRSE